MACHQFHTYNTPYARTARFDSPQETFCERPERNPSFSFYVRTDNRHIRADKLRKIEIFSNGKSVEVSDDPAQKLCTQCHSPNFAHVAVIQCDCTQTGVHEGLSCMACHSPHSNDARNSCKNCHRPSRTANWTLQP